MTAEAMPVHRGEKLINIESVRIPHVRDNYGSLDKLGLSIANDGLRRAITVWNDGTLISGARRLRSAFLLSGEPGGSKYRRIPAVFVDTIESATKRLLADQEDDFLSRPMAPSDMCRLWEILLRLDGPAAARRLDAARRRGVELRRQTQAGKREPGRAGSRGDNYALGLAAQAFGLSEATASRMMVIYNLATSAAGIDDDRRAQAVTALANLDLGIGSVWRYYVSLVKGRAVRAPVQRPTMPAQSAPAARQLAAWNRALPQLEGLIAGLVELGPPNPDLTWEQISPVLARLALARRTTEKIINQMKGANQS